MANIIKSIEKIPDFKNDIPGERNCMKGLSAITAAACLLVLAATTKNPIAEDTYMALTTSCTVLFAGYSTIGVVQLFKNEINKYYL